MKYQILLFKNKSSILTDCIKSTIKFFAIIVLLFLSNSCCKYPSDRTLTINFENFDFSKLDSVLLIKTNKDDFQQSIDTTYFNLSISHTIDILVYEDNSINDSYLIKDFKDQFEHTISDIQAKTYRASISTSMCQEWKFSFKLDSIDYGYDYSHEVIIKP